MGETNVSSIRRKVEPTGDASYLAFTYGEFRYDHASRRALGYRTATAESSRHVAAGIRLTVENEQHAACAGRRTREVVSLQGGGSLTELSRTYEKSQANGNFVCVLQEEFTTRFEYGGAPITTRKRFERDNSGNVTVLWDDGEFVDANKDGLDEATDDNRWTVIKYVGNPTKYLMSFPSQTTRYGHLAQVIGQERFSYDNLPFSVAPSTGNATTKEEWDDQSVSWLATTVSYWPNGAPRRTQGPTGVWQETTYDSGLSLFPEKVCNAVYCTTQHWDARFGKLDRAEDANGEITQYRFDVFGRLTRTVFNDGACLMHTWGNLGDPKRQFSFEGICSSPNEETDLTRSLGVVTHFDGAMRPWRQVRQGTYERFVRHWGTTALVRSAERWHSIGGTGASTETFYEYLGRPVRVTNPDGSERRIGYWPGHIAASDENGNVRELTRDVRPEHHTWSDPTFHQLDFTYDSLDRLTDVSGELSQHFAYDAAGRMAFNSTVGGSYVYGSNPAHGVRKAGSIALSYDASGNAAKIESNLLEWNEDGLLVRGTTKSGNVAWGYAADGSRVFKVVGNSPTFYFGGLAEQDANGLKYHYRFGSRVLAERTGGDVSWIHRDLVSSTRAISDASGAITSRFDNEPFGKELASTGKRPTLGYRAEHFDAETGLVLLGARYYHPEIGRFISADSIIPDLENTQAHDRYAYAYNSPIGLVDPTGHAPRSVNAAPGAPEPEKKDGDKKQVPLHDYCKAHPDDQLCNAPDGAPQPVNVQPLDPLLAAQNLHRKQAANQRTPEQKGWDSRTAKLDLATRLWNFINTGTWTEKGALEVGEDTGFNSLTRYFTGHDIFAEKLSPDELEANLVDGVGKVGETIGTVATVVEVGAVLLEGSAAAAAVEGAAMGAEGAAEIPGWCFAQGTLVLTQSGYQPIDAIRSGDKVFAYSIDRASVTLRDVVTTTVNRSPTLALEFTTAHGASTTIRATLAHPFLLCDRRWIEAALLRPGDCLVTATGTASVVGVGLVDRVESVFNFEVEGDHDYFVSELAVAVHNTSRYSRPSGATTRAQRASVQGQPCVDCGATAPKMYADHKNPLVKQHYEGGGIDKTRMRSLSEVQPQCPTCSNRQGGQLSGYSREKAKELDLE